MRTKWDVFRVQHHGYALGAIINLRAVWVGVHSSFSNKRVCINAIPCLTFWLCTPGGTHP